MDERLMKQRSSASTTKTKHFLQCQRTRVVFNVLHAQNWLKDGAFTFNVYDAVAMSYLMKNVGRSSAKESDWTNSKLATDGQAHIHLPAPVYCPDVGGQLNHPPPNRARVCH